MAIPVPARIPLVAGGIGLLLTVLNQLQAESADPSLQRASVLASILSVVLMLVAVLGFWWVQWQSAPPAGATDRPSASAKQHGAVRDDY